MSSPTAAGADPAAAGAGEAGGPSSSQGGGWTALHEAGYEGQTEVVKLLLAGGAQPDAVTEVRGAGASLNLLHAFPCYPAP